MSSLAGCTALLLLAVITCSFHGNSAAETIVLKSGKTVTGRIIGQSKDGTGIIMDIKGAPVVYQIADIDYIKEERESSDANILPMYGGMPKTKADQEFIEAATREAGSKGSASQKHMEFGWQYFDGGDLKTAMKRFNQAWLLNPNNADVFWGFGSVALAKRDPDGAIEMFNKAIALNPKHAIAMCLLGSAYQLKTYTVGLHNTSAPSYLQKSVRLCEEGSQIDPKEEFCYSTWAGTLFLQKRYAEAWEKVGMAKMLGGRTLNSDFIRDLSTAMPEPK